MNTRKYFGTDGIRGKVGETPITPDFVLKLGWAAGKILARQEGSRKVLIGKDTRISGYMLESALEAGLASAGISSAFTGPMPTPAIAYLTRTFRAVAGIVISASHNRFDNNGIKFFSAEGRKIADEMEAAIESEMENSILCVESAQLGRASRIVDATGRYIEFCKGTFPSNLNLNGLKIMIDCANGATYHIAPNVFCELGAQVIPIAIQPNGMNINKECGTTDLRLLQRGVLQKRMDLGLAYDGDGDRIMMIDHLGNKVDGDQIVYIIAREYLRQGQLKGGVVGTLMSNMGVELGFKKLNIPFIRSQVGDRHVMEKMNQKGWRLGAENSGHVILLDKHSTGDGIIASLQVLTAMVRNNMSLYELCNGINMFPQVLLNIRFSNFSNALHNHDLQLLKMEAENTLGNHGRILLRKSGTEPLIRIMVEGEDEVKINMLANELAEAIKNFKQTHIQ